MMPAWRGNGTWAPAEKGSVLMTNRMVQFPRTAMKYMRQIGIEIKCGAPSSPGIPINRNVETAASEALTGSIINRSLTYCSVR